MNHKPVLHYRVLQLGLLLMFNLLTGLVNAHVQRLPSMLNTSQEGPPCLQRVTSCKSGVYLPGVDCFRFSEQVKVKHLDEGSIAKIYIGDKSNPLDFLLCTVTLGQCPAVTPDPGCYCTRDLPNLDVFNISVSMELAIEMEHQNIYMIYKPSLPGATTAVLFVKPLPEMIDPSPGLEVTVNDNLYDVSDLKCLRYTPPVKARVRFCVEKLQNPQITMHFDAKQHWEYPSSCIESSIQLSLTHLGTKFWFTYKDSCRRHRTILCLYPTGASSGPPTPGLFPVLSLAYLLAYILAYWT